MSSSESLLPYSVMTTSRQNTFWKGKHVLVTGGTGFVGSHLVERLIEEGSRVRILTSGSGTDMPHINHLLREIEIVRGDATSAVDARKACHGQAVVMNLAARVGGIAYNRVHNASMLSQNFAIAQTMMDAARIEGVSRFLVVSSACIYPHDATVPTPESEGFRGEPEPTNGGYGWAKRMAEKLGTYMAEEYGMSIATVRPYNCYGPRDRFDPETSHVIPALIKRVLDGEDPLVVWGSGRQTRAFLFVEDLARGMMLATEKSPDPDAINIGTDEEVSIRDLVSMILRITGKTPRVEFDSTKPDGHPRRNSDNTRAEQVLGFRAEVRLQDGLERTIRWYKDTVLSGKVRAHE